MRILPPRTRPARRKIDRHHHPKIPHYKQFRDCLRWEFGFSCAFCALHEADLEPFGAKGSGSMHIEHFRLQDAGRSPDTNLYDNCFYACKYCNLSRGRRPLQSKSGAQLLNPCTVQWSDRFSLQSNHLVPAVSDADAAYTLEVYDLNAPNKVRRRRHRRRAILDAVCAYRRFPGDIDRFLRLAAMVKDSTDRRELLKHIRILRIRWKDAIRQLARFRAEPKDRNAACRCSIEGACNLPLFLNEQCWTLNRGQRRRRMRSGASLDTLEARTPESQGTAEPRS